MDLAIINEAFIDMQTIVFCSEDCTLPGTSFPMMMWEKCVISPCVRNVYWLSILYRFVYNYILIL